MCSPAQAGAQTLAKILFGSGWTPACAGERSNHTSLRSCATSFSDYGANGVSDGIDIDHRIRRHTAQPLASGDGGS